MGLFGGGAKTVNLRPFMDAAKEAQQKGEGAIADFESVANDFASMGQANYNKSTELFGSWKRTMDDYYSSLNVNEFGAQAQQQILQQQEQQNQGVMANMTAGGISPDSAFMLDMYDQAGMAGSVMSGEGQVKAKYDMYAMQQDWSSYGQQQMAQDFQNYGMGVQMQGQQAQVYSNMYAGQASNANSLMSQQASQNQQAKVASQGSLGGLGSLVGMGIGFAVGGPAGAMVGGGIGGAAGGMVQTGG